MKRVLVYLTVVLILAVTYNSCIKGKIAHTPRPCHKYSEIMK